MYKYVMLWIFFYMTIKFSFYLFLFWQKLSWKTCHWQEWPPCFLQQQALSSIKWCWHESFQGHWGNETTRRNYTSTKDLSAVIARDFCRGGWWSACCSTNFLFNPHDFVRQETRATAPTSKEQIGSVLQWRVGQDTEGWTIPLGITQ